jgi:hypothetical protein
MDKPAARLQERPIQAPDLIALPCSASDSTFTRSPRPARGPHSSARQGRPTGGLGRGRRRSRGPSAAPRARDPDRQPGSRPTAARWESTADSSTTRRERPARGRAPALPAPATRTVTRPRGGGNAGTRTFPFLILRGENRWRIQTRKQGNPGSIPAFAD